MSKKLKRISVLFLSILLLSSLLPMSALALGEIETVHPAELTVLYKDGAKPIPDARFSLYRVADVDAYSHMTLTDVFAPYENSVAGLSALNDLPQEQWVTLPTTLRLYVLRDQLPRTAEGRTDGEGRLVFPNLRVGLYLITGSRVTTDDYYTYTSVPFLVLLPGTDSVTGEWDYEVTAVPKHTKEYDPPDDDDDFVTRKALKKWDDLGYETLRPAEITVQLLKDGEVFDTQVLNQDNSWRCAWDNLDADFEWNVVEADMEGYSVSIDRSGITFVITNKYTVPLTEDNITVRKRLTGEKPPAASTFSFILTAKDDSAPMPAESNGSEKIISVLGAGSAGFGEISFRKAGTYVYTVSERFGGIEGYTYDSTVFTVTYVVTEQDGELSSVRTIRNSTGYAVPEIEFSNNYKKPHEILPKTGVLWWPVPLLLCAGLASVMIGIAVRRRRCDE
ncbi:MAG: Cna B-type domain-containing protein [Clostridiales bacterium]|nr:Cna B-type domain-containing protein [Candidatus Apopatocola equi]